MGKPKFSRKKYETPSHPWQEERIKDEDELLRKYGLKNKREVWKAETVLRKYRGQARELLAKIRSGNPQIKKESDQLLMRLTRLSILPPNSTLDDVLALETESILSRRLQTLTYLKGLANTPMHARQLISHGHIAVAGRKTTVPGYMVKKDEENEIGYLDDSPLNDLLHPARPRADFKSSPIKKDKEQEKPKEGKTDKKSEGAKGAEEKESSKEKNSEGKTEPTTDKKASEASEKVSSEQEKPVEETKEVKGTAEVEKIEKKDEPNAKGGEK